jgi:hypothetical protein
VSFNPFNDSRSQLCPCSNLGSLMSSLDDGAGEWVCEECVDMVSRLRVSATDGCGCGGVSILGSSGTGGGSFSEYERYESLELARDTGREIAR